MFMYVFESIQTLQQLPAAIFIFNQNQCVGQLDQLNEQLMHALGPLATRYYEN